MGPKPVPADGGSDRALLLRSEERLRTLRAMEPLGGRDLKGLLADQGISRRSFVTWVSATTAMLMLPAIFEPQVAEAAELTNRIPVLWLEGQDCAGNSEALLRAVGPTIDELLFNVISLEYHETLMAAAGFQAQRRKEEAARRHRGRYLLIVEGSIPQGDHGAYCTIGPEAKPFLQEVQELADGAAAVIAVGACAFDGGAPAANPNPTRATGVMSVVKGKPVVNVPACPMNPANLMGTILHYTMTGTLPPLDSEAFRVTGAHGV
ncbi:MAG: hydrogenase small subunit [Actinobacteria bacterium]|nr:hydrogenase small subunit [Actinomycetota bacterium]